MPAISIAKVVDQAPMYLDAYSKTEDGARRIEDAIADAEATVDEETWGAKYHTGLALYAAHLVLSRNPNLGSAQGGVLQSVKIGGMEKTYAVAQTAGSSTTGPHSSTGPGALYDTMLRTLNPGFFYSS